MIDIKCFMCSLKLGWIKRLLCSTDSSWIHVFEQTICPIYKIVKFGSGWCKHLSTVVTNKFWVEIFQIWTNFCDKIDCKSEDDILASPIWYNPLISNQNLFFPKWFQSGIEYVGDLVDKNWHFIDNNCLKQKYNLTLNNFLEVYRLRHLVIKYISTCKVKHKANFQRPSIPRHILFVLANKEKARGFYKILLEKPLNFHLNLNKKWKNELSLDLSEEVWSKIFRISFKVSSDFDIAWFQYRIIHKILGTQYLLFKMSIKDSSKCLLCNDSPETLIHIFCECPKVTQLWREIEDWVYAKTNVVLILSAPEKLLGYLKLDYFVPINAIILQIKKYIFSTSRKNENLLLFTLKANLKTFYNEQYSLARINFREHIFVKQWSIFSVLFD